MIFGPIFIKICASLPEKRYLIPLLPQHQDVPKLRRIRRISRALLRTMPSHSPTQRKHLLQPLYDLEGYIQEILPLNHHQVHQTLEPLQRLRQPGPVKGYLVISWPFSITGQPSLLQLTSGRSLLDSPLLPPPLLVTRDRQSFFVAILSWALRRPDPLQKKGLNFFLPTAQGI